MATQARPEGAPLPPERPVGTTPALGWGTHAPWGAMTAGALAGFAAFLILTTLGVAIGVTIAPAEVGAQEIGIGAGIWWLITLLATGIFGGWVLGRMSRSDRPYMPVMFGTVTWVLGILILFGLLAVGMGNVLGGVGGALGQAMAGQPDPLGVVEGVQVAGIATSTAWALFGSMVVGLLATIGGAYWGAPARMHGEGPRLEAR